MDEELSTYVPPEENATKVDDTKQVDEKNPEISVDVDTPRLTAKKDQDDDSNTVLKDIDRKTQPSKLEETADSVISQPIKNITEKNDGATVPSGNRHDYVSQSPYWWQGETEPRDGQINPDIKKYTDPDILSSTGSGLLLVAVASKDAKSRGDMTKTTAYAVYAERVLKTWFVDEQTRMTPHLEFAQMIPGEQIGKFWGIIEGFSLLTFVDAASRFEKQGLLQGETLDKTKEWFGQYLDWLLTSEKAVGKKDAENEKERGGERGMSNNHGTFYDAQIAVIADFLGRDDLVRSTLESAKGRIDTQIEADGEMPEETKREMPYDYQLFNLYGFSILAKIGEKHGVNLWHYKSVKGSGLEEAFDYFSKQLKQAGSEPFHWDRKSQLFLTFRAAAAKYHKKEYFDLPTQFYHDNLLDKATADEFGK